MPAAIAGEAPADLPPELSIDEIMKGVDSFYDAAKDQQYHMTMVLIDSGGERRERRISYMAMGEKHSLTRFLYPASVRGMGFLQAGEDTFHVYLPDFHKVRRVAAHAKRQSFQGTDFSYNDMKNQRFTVDYEAKLVGREAGHYIVDLEPRPKSDIEYSRIRLTVEPDHFMVLTLDYFDARGKRVKRQSREEPELVQGIWMQHKVTMKDLRTGHRTELHIDNIRFNRGLTKDRFTIRELRKAF